MERLATRRAQPIKPKRFGLLVGGLLVQRFAGMASISLFLLRSQLFSLIRRHSPTMRHRRRRRRHPQRTCSCWTTLSHECAM